jgi:tetratricopeptide (TPR) repeat protein
MKAAFSLVAGAEWPAFLRAHAVARDVEVPLSARVIETVAGPDDLSRVFQDSYRPAAGSVVLSRRRLREVVTRCAREQQREFHDLGAEFVYPLAADLNEIRAQDGSLLRVADALNATDEGSGPVSGPSVRGRWLEARDLFVEGCAKAAELLFPEALDWLRRAEEKYPTDFMVQFELGWVYLYGVTAEDNVVDLSRAEEHLRRAVRYGRGAVRRFAALAAPTAEALLHLSIATWLRGPEHDRAVAGRARQMAADAVEVNPKLAQGFYHLAKYAAALGDGAGAVAVLEHAFTLDRGFALLVDADGDLAPVRSQVAELIGRMSARSREGAASALSHLEQLEKLKREMDSCDEHHSRLNEAFARASDAAAAGQQDYAYFPGRVSTERLQFDEAARNVTRSLERLDRLCVRADQALAEADALAARARDVFAAGTLFGLQDAEPLAKQALTPLKRTVGFLADAQGIVQSCGERVPRLERDLDAVALEREVNRRAYSRWRVFGVLRGSVGMILQLAAAGAVLGVIGRAVYELVNAGPSLANARAGFAKAPGAALAGAGFGLVIGLVVALSQALPAGTRGARPRSPESREGPPRAR